MHRYCSNTILVLACLLAFHASGCSLTAVPTHELTWTPVPPDPPAQLEPPAGDLEP